MKTSHSRFIKRPLMTYYGSKFKFAEWVCGILERIPHDVYVSPFGGSGGDILGRTFPAAIEAWNDIDGTLAGLFYVLREPDLFSQFLRRLEYTEYSQVNVREAVDILKRHDRGENVDPVLLAWATYYRAWSGYVGTMHRSDMFGYVKNLIGGNNPPKQFRGAVEALPQIAARLRDIQIFNEDFEVFVKRFDQGENTLIYCLTPDTQIRMENEKLIPIQDLKSGDRVYGGNTVLNVMHRQHNGDIIKVRYSGYHKPLCMTPDHRVLHIPAEKIDSQAAQEGGILSAASIIAADKLQVGDYLLMPTNGKEEPIFPSIFDCDGASFNDCPELYRLLGYFISRGDVAKYEKEKNILIDSIVFSLDSADNANELIRDIVNCCQAAFNFNPIVQPEFYRVIVPSNHVAMFIKSLVSSPRPVRMIASRLMTAPVADQKELLRGWFLGNDNISEDNIFYVCGTTPSSVLGDQLYTLCLRCGLRPDMWESGDNDGLKYIGIDRECASIFSQNISNKQCDSANVRKIIDGFVLRRITYIAITEYSGPVWDIDVDGDDLFPANFVLSHNCDPPYPMESRSSGGGYVNDATDDLLIRLRNWALNAACSVAISSYPCDWAQSFVEAGWSCYDKNVKAHSAMGRFGGAAGDRVELILTNPIGQQKMDEDFTTL